MAASTKKQTPSQVKAAEQTLQLLAALRAARENGDYPLSVSELAERAAVPVKDALTRLSSKEVKGEVLIAATKDVAAPIVLATDQSTLAGSDKLFTFAATKVREKRSKAGVPLEAIAKSLVGDTGIAKSLKKEFEKALNVRIANNSLPAMFAELLLTPHQIAAKLLAALTRDEQSLPESPLVPQSRLLADLNLPASDKDVKAALKLPEFLEKVLVCNDVLAKKKVPAFILPSSLALRIPQLVQQAIAWKVTNTKGTTVFNAGELATVFFAKKQSGDFAKSIEQYCNTHPQLAPEIGWLRIKDERQFFRRQDIEPTTTSAPVAAKPTAPPATAPAATTAPNDFAALFDAAFARLDARQGHRNYLKVHDLRHELAQFSRAQFDAGLRQLRIADKYTMEGASGTLPLSDAERAAGIQEGPLLLIYVSQVK